MRSEREARLDKPRRRHTGIDSSARLRTSTLSVTSSTTWAQKLAGLTVVGLFAQACIVPDVTCEYTKTCGETSLDASVLPTSTAATDAAIDATATPTVDDADATSSGNASNGHGSFIDGGLTSDEDASIISAPIDCAFLEDCQTLELVCHETEHVCTQCTKEFHCSPFPDRRFCKVRPGHEQDNECVQCLADADCTNGVCVDNACRACNPKTNNGCTNPLPQCVELDEVPTCVACATNEHCGADAPVCADNTCALCTNEDTTHCPPEAPLCATDEPVARCVGCRDANDCTGMLTGETQVDGLCINQKCTVCELGTNLNCAPSFPYCTALIPETDSGVSRFAPPATDARAPANQYLDFEHECVECLDDQACKGGSTPACFNGSCVECTATPHCNIKPEASVCDATTHLCIGCSQGDECVHLASTPACDVANRLCVECTADNDSLCGNKACKTTPGDAQYTCSEAQKRSANICDECLSDAHCPNNSACVLETFAGTETGYRCLPIQGLWDQGKECGDITPPFVGSVATTSIDGRSAMFCKPRSTSCQGYADYGRGTVSNDSGLATCTNNDDCGLPGVADGVCVAWTETTNHCTYPCASDADCHTSCNGVTAVDESVQQVCSLDL